MGKNWLVVANSTKAKIFTLAPPAPRLKNPQSPPYSTEALQQSRLVEFEALESGEGQNRE